MTLVLQLGLLLLNKITGLKICKIPLDLIIEFAAHYRDNLNFQAIQTFDIGAS